MYTGSTLHRKHSAFSTLDHLTFDDATLEAEDLVLQLADRAGLSVTERLSSLLHGADHGRGAAQENLDVGSRGREALLLSHS